MYRPDEIRKACEVNACRLAAGASLRRGRLLHHRVDDPIRFDKHVDERAHELGDAGEHEGVHRDRPHLVGAGRRQLALAALVGLNGNGNDEIDGR